MSLRDLNLKLEYRSSSDDFVKDFYTPVLNEAILYKRAVGFFSSSILVQITKGLHGLIKNGGKIKLVASPHLSEKDISDIKDGYKRREQVIEDALIRELKDPSNDIEKDRLNLLSNLIAASILDIKIAITENNGIYHEKLGIIEDSENNKIVFAGSLNETFSAVKDNYEVIDVHCSWEVDKFVPLKINAFESIWNNKEKKLDVLDFPKVKEEILKRYMRGKFNYDRNLDVEEKIKEDPAFLNCPKMPNDFELRDYQENAILKWKEQNYRGIFDMATGTGKTRTSLGALIRLFNDKSSEEKLFTIIVCPYQHLVDQWVEEIEKINVKPVIGFSSSPQKNWKDKFKRDVFASRYNVEKKFFCLICTNATFASKFVQDNIKRIRCPKLLLVDEAHNFGATYLSKFMLEDYEYRIGLSATINRHGDEEGTEKLFDFFGQKCIEYDIERAIKEGFLTPYNYYPVLITLSFDELADYKQLSEEIKKNIIIDNKGKKKLNEKGKNLAMKRARIIAGAKEKIPALKKEISRYKNDTHILVYCGATKELVENSDITEKDEEEERQIVTVSKMLGNELGIKNHHFTSNEKSSERTKLKELFTNGDLQALVAIKCLDEGVDIPKIKTAFILASTTNPKEYIQRRGRVLRLAEGKDRAEIYDFITLPYKINKVSFKTEEEINVVKSLVKRELCRAKEFWKNAENKYDVINNILDEIKDAYNIHIESDNFQEDIFNE